MKKYYVVEMGKILDEPNFIITRIGEKILVGYDKIDEAKEACEEFCQEGYILDFEEMKIIKSISKGLKIKYFNKGCALAESILDAKENFKGWNTLDEDPFREEFWNVKENREQYSEYSLLASEINSFEDSDTLWDNFDEGVSQTLEKVIEDHFN